MKYGGNLWMFFEGKKTDWLAGEQAEGVTCLSVWLGRSGGGREKGKEGGRGMVGKQMLDAEQTWEQEAKSKPLGRAKEWINPHKGIWW